MDSFLSRQFYSTGCAFASSSKPSLQYILDFSGLPRWRRRKARLSGSFSRSLGMGICSAWTSIQSVHTEITYVCHTELYAPQTVSDDLDKIAFALCFGIALELILTCRYHHCSDYLAVLRKDVTRLPRTKFLTRGFLVSFVSSSMSLKPRGPFRPSGLPPASTRQSTPA